MNDNSYHKEFKLNKAIRPIQNLPILNLNSSILNDMTVSKIHATEMTLTLTLLVPYNRSCGLLIYIYQLFNLPERIVTFVTVVIYFNLLNVSVAWYTCLKISAGFFSLFSL